jgi:phosphate transport system protein
MSKHLQRDLDSLQRQLMNLFAIVEQMIDSSIRALCEKRLDLASNIRAIDRQVNEMEVLIEEDCLKILALHQPVAANLRRISAVLKVNTDLERIGDLAKNIAERAEGVHQYPWFPIPDQLAEMARQATQMVRMALDAFVASDSQLAQKVIHCDSAVDAFNRAIIGELVDLMRSDSTLLDPALHCFSATRHIERIADHAENIAEDVVYFVDGDIVRHKHGAFSPGKASS